MSDFRFESWQLVRIRGRGPYNGSAWRIAAHVYRDRAINCMDAMRMLQADMHVWEDAYKELEEKNAQLRMALAEKEN
jgi:hypothetical protein